MIEPKPGVSPSADAQRSVSFISNAALVQPHYTKTALYQMGYQRGTGMSLAYREAFAKAFAEAWCLRYRVLTGQEPND